MEPEGLIDAPLFTQTIGKVVISKRGKSSQTLWTLLEAFQHYSLIEANPLTGRTHQIRVHCSFIGHPVVGDPVYGHRHKSLPLDRQFLHAAKVRFALPGSGEQVEFESPLPDDLQAILQQLRS